jgi:hypothetical protein
MACRTTLNRKKGARIHVPSGILTLDLRVRAVSDLHTNRPILENFEPIIFGLFFYIRYTFVFCVCAYACKPIQTFQYC